MMMLVITLKLRIILDDVNGDRVVKAKYSRSSVDCMILNRPIDKYHEIIFYDNFQKKMGKYLIMTLDMEK